MATSISRALILLDYMARQRAPVRISDLARRFDLPKSNIHRLLQELTETGYVGQGADGRYHPTLKLYELGALVVARHPLRTAATPFIQQLAHDTRHAAVVAMLDGSDVFHLERVIPSGTMRSMMGLGFRVPACFTASGQAILAHHPDAERLAVEMIAASDRQDWISRDSLMTDLEQVRARGFASTCSGWTSRLNSVAAPVLVYREGKTVPVGSIAVMDRDVDMPSADFPQVAAAVMNAAAEIGNIMAAMDVR